MPNRCPSLKSICVSIYFIITIIIIISLICVLQFIFLYFIKFYFIIKAISAIALETTRNKMSIMLINIIRVI